MNYGQPYSPTYGAPGYADAGPGYNPRGLAALAPQGFMTAAGDPATTPQTPVGAGNGTDTTSTISNWLNTPTVGVPRKYLLGGAVALTGIYYAYSQGWFEGAKRGRARRDVNSRRSY